MKKISIVLGALLLVGSISSCKKEEKEKDKLEIPTTYDGTNFNANTVTEDALIKQIVALTDEGKKGRNLDYIISKSTLEDLFTIGSPSLSTEITLYYKEKFEGNNGWFDKMAKASGNRWVPQAPEEGDKGGVFAGYLFDENGLEYQELIEKINFQAILFNRAINLMQGNISLSTVDQLVAVFGAKPTFANSASNNVAIENRDRAMANYAARRDKNDGKGFYSQIKKAFITLQAAILAGDDYQAEQKQAIKDIKLLWEKISMATVINYCHSPISKLSATTPSDADRASALHAINEGIGFLYGIKEINQTHRKITDAQIDEILVLFNAPATGTATVYKFATDPVTELTKLQDAIDKLKAIYGFSTQEIEDFKTNWVSSQNR
jgi:hypothetical protein